ADGGRGGAGQGHGQQGAPPGTAPGARLAVGGGLGLFGAGRVVGDVEGQGHGAFLSGTGRGRRAPAVVLSARGPGKSAGAGGALRRSRPGSGAPRGGGRRSRRGRGG